MTVLGAPNRYLAEARTAAEAEAAAARAHDPRRADRDVTIVLLVAAVSLTCSHFLSQNGSWIVTGLRGVGARDLSHRLDVGFTTSPHAQFWLLVEWAVFQIAGYVVLPTITIKLVLRARLRDFGVRVRGIAPFFVPYFVLYLVALPFLVAASYTAEFQSRYPFYALAPHEHFGPYLYLWWGFYALQFMALEFFFRGFLVHGLVPRFGWLAVPIMVVPYNMLHYGKPMPEALAAIVGGLVLGTLAIRTRSIWWGAALHISIAASMDLLSLWQHGRIF